MTGGAGYIGSHTVVALTQSGFEPVIIDDFRNAQTWIIDRLKQITQQEISHHAIDCNDLAKVREVFSKCTHLVGVIHFAAYKSVHESVQNPVMYYQNNIGTLCTILEAMREFHVEHLVFSSSCTVYGEPQKPVVTEEEPVQQPASPYGATKVTCEALLQSVMRSAAPLKTVLLRYFNPIGAHPSSLIGELPQGVPNNLVPYITQTAKGLRAELTVFGRDYPTPDGTCIRDYIHVVDLANAHVHAIEWLFKQSSSCCEAFNVGTGKGHSVLELIRTFEETNQLQLNYIFGERRAGDITQIWANPQKANSTLHWKWNYTLAEALRHAWLWEQTIP